MKKIHNIKKLNKEQEVFLEKNYVDNSINARVLFNQEVVYQYDNKDRFSLELYNKIYGDVFYGKMNKNKEVVLPNTFYVIQIPGLKKNVYTFSFVEKAYNEFRNKMNWYERNGILNTFKLIPILPIEGYVNFEDLYEKQFNSYYEVFSLFISQNNLNKKIINFETFLNIFSMYISRSTPVTPFTATKYISSRYCVSNVNALTLVLDNKQSNSYKQKEELLSNPNFKLFNETANLYGFIIDKNEPWKMHFNIHSPRAKEYIDRIKESSDFFEDFYIKINQYDVYFLKKHLFNFYNRFVEERPRFTEANFKVCKKEVKSKSKIINREILNNTDIQRELNSETNLEWWRFYLFTRSCEQNLVWTQAEFDDFASESYRLISLVDKSEALRYIESKIASQAKSKEKIRTYKF